MPAEDLDEELNLVDRMMARATICAATSKTPDEMQVDPLARLFLVLCRGNQIARSIVHCLRLA